MSRPRAFSYPYTLKLNQLDRALVEYYAKRYRTDKSRVMRGMVREYIRQDKSFDAADFRRFVDETMVPEAGDDKDLVSEIRTRIGGFLADLEKRTS